MIIGRIFSQFLEPGHFQNKCKYLSASIWTTDFWQRRLCIFTSKHGKQILYAIVNEMMRSMKCRTGGSSLNQLQCSPWKLHGNTPIFQHWWLCWIWRGKPGRWEGRSNAKPSQNLVPVYEGRSKCKRGGKKPKSIFEKQIYILNPGQKLKRRPNDNWSRNTEKVG